jgi:hypothetical protein
MPRQDAKARCWRCDILCVVVRADAHNFDWRCECGTSGRISWASQSPPPEFEENLPLFPEHEAKT